MRHDTKVDLPEFIMPLTKIVVRASSAVDIGL